MHHTRFGSHGSERHHPSKAALASLSNLFPGDDIRTVVHQHRIVVVSSALADCACLPMGLVLHAFHYQA